MSEWADKYRYLSSEASSEPGKWDTGRAEYLRGVMDACSEPDIWLVVCMFSTQVGKTEVINNVVGSRIHTRPGPIMVVQPTISMGEAWSTDRLAPMLRDTPALQGLVADPKSRDSGNTKLYKSFIGGQVTIAGANSPAGLAMRPIRDLLMDEPDRYPPSAGSEGDPASLAIKRTATFADRLVVMTASPTHSQGRISIAFEGSDKRQWWVPCPQCKTSQLLRWPQVQWLRDGLDNPRPETAYYACEHCGSVMNDTLKNRAVAAGEWRSTATTKGIAGFHLNELYSPWVAMSDMAERWIEANRTKNRNLLKTFVNTSLAETFDDSSGINIDPMGLMTRLEEYGPELPEGVLVLTAGIDTQDDRLECEIVGWGKDFESWGIEYTIFPGSPGNPAVWADLEAYLNRRFAHKNGTSLRISYALIDSGGHFTTEVLRFAKSRDRSVPRIYASKGASIAGKPVATITKAQAGQLYISVGTDTAKNLVASWLANADEPGPGYCHFKMGLHTPQYFQQLTVERCETVMKNGQFVYKWIKPEGKRNEPFDCRVLALAGMDIALNGTSWELLTESMSNTASRKKLQAQLAPQGKTLTTPPAPQRRGRRVISEGC